MIGCEWKKLKWYWGLVLWYWMKGERGKLIVICKIGCGLITLIAILS